MKLYPTATVAFLEQTGRYRTKASKTSFGGTMSQFQSRHPNKHVGQFTSADLHKYCSEVGLAPNTIKRRVSMLRAVFEWATWRGMCTTNPSNDLKFTVHPGNHVVKFHKWLTEDEVRRITAAFPDSPVGRRDRLIFFIGVFLGLRVGEIASLRRSMFSPDFSEVKLTGKGQKLAQMGVGATLQRELTAWMADAPEGCETVIPCAVDVTLAWDLTDPTVTFTWSKPMGAGGIRLAVTRAGARVDIKVRPHDLRRTFAGLLEERGMPVQDISRALRHSNVAVTSRYLERNPRRSADLTRGFDLDL